MIDQMICGLEPVIFLKKEYRDRLQDELRTSVSREETIVLTTMIDYLRINIAELEHVVLDLKNVVHQRENKEEHF